MTIKVEVLDNRRNQLGEGPTSSGENNNHIQWCDIYGRKVRWQNLITAQTGEFATNEDVGFQIPRVHGGEVLGTANGPVLRDLDGTLHKLPTRVEADGKPDATLLRWNDAKIASNGDLFLGTMAYQNQKDEGSFYRLTKDGKKLEKLFDKVAISNGMDWTKDNSRMFYIDTLTMKVEVFDYKPLQSKVIENRRTFISIGENMGYPDGMCTDSQDNLWVAFWMGSCVRGYDGKTGKQIAEIKLPNPKVTSCCFGGEKLDKLIITTAVGNPGEDMDLKEFPTAGFIFVAEPGVTGKPTNLFQV